MDVTCQVRIDIACEIERCDDGTVYTYTVEFNARTYIVGRYIVHRCSVDEDEERTETEECYCGRAVEPDMQKERIYEIDSDGGWDELDSDDIDVVEERVEEEINQGISEMLTKMDRYLRFANEKTKAETENE